MGFLFGGDTGQTQESITDARRRMAFAQIQQGMASTPIQSPWQGAARLSEALMGGLQIRKQQQQQNDAHASLMATLTGQPAPAPSQDTGFLSSLFGSNKVPASDAQGQVAAASPAVPSTGDNTASAPMSGNQQDFVNAILPAAIEEGKRTGVDPRIIVAQGALESGWGKHAPGNNYFGIKSHGQPGGNTLATTEYGADGQPHGETASFRAYQSPADSVKGYGDFILQNPRYEPLRNAQGLDAQLQALGASGYASSPKYAGSVGAIARGLQIPNQVASLDPSAGMGQQSPQQSAYVDPQVTTAGQAPNPAMQAIQQQAPLPGPGGQMAPPDPTQTASVGPMQPPQAAPPMAAPVNIPNQPISNPQPADLSGVGMGGAAPGPGQFPTAPGDGRARLAAAMQGAPSQPPGAAPQQQLAQALQGAQGGQGSPLAGNPKAIALMQAMTNPNTSPQDRELAGAMLQQTMAPQLDFVTRPDGSIVAINKLSGQAVGTPVGAMKTDSVIDGPTDPQTGMPTKLIWNAVDGVKGRLGSDGSVQPVGQGQQQQAPLPGAIPAPPPGVDPKKYREDAATRSANDLLPNAHDETSFATDITNRKNYQEYSAAVPTFNSFTKHIQDNTPAADKAIVDDFAKILNPGRAVTTGGFVLNMDAQGIPELLQGQIQKAVNGNGELGPDARAQMAKIAEDKMTEYKSAWDLDANQFTSIAKAHHLDPDRVIPKLPDLIPIDYGKINTLKTTQAGTAPAGQSAGAKGPVQIQNVDDYNALPSGTQYIDPNGKPRTKQ